MKGFLLKPNHLSKTGMERLSRSISWPIVPWGDLDKNYFISELAAPRSNLVKKGTAPLPTPGTEVAGRAPDFGLLNRSTNAIIVSGRNGSIM